MSSLVALISVLPELIALGREIMTFVNKISGDDPKVFLSKCAQTFQELNQAKTSEEYDAVARKISELYSHLP